MISPYLKLESEGSVNQGTILSRPVRIVVLGAG